MNRPIDLSKFNNTNFDRGSGRVKELLWWIARSCFFASWLPIPSDIKVFVLRLFGAEIGSNVVLRSRINISFPWRFKCGDNVWIGEDVFILSLANVSIGSNTCISQRAFLCTGSHDFGKEAFDLITKPILIGSHVWVGAQCFVGPGVQIHDSSQCLPCSVVVEDVPEKVIVGGVPAVVKASNA